MNDIRKQQTSLFLSGSSSAQLHGIYGGQSDQVNTREDKGMNSFLITTDRNIPVIRNDRKTVKGIQVINKISENVMTLIGKPMPIANSEAYSTTPTEEGNISKSGGLNLMLLLSVTKFSR
ncbi:unnamed protein product [Thelazia callipaeda]|uniref:Plug domain-containing protein n=1 Tax=Thelazia callipaeda TaxID=103827 RepID=A0A0N5DC20_THECL|nr:unnamed protein product [Thelazia callipaeda]